MIPRIVLDVIHAGSALLPRQLEDRIRRIAAVVNGGLDASSLATVPMVKFAIGATAGTVQNAWREPNALVVVPMFGSHDLDDETGIGWMDVAGAPPFPFAATVVEWGCAWRTTPSSPTVAGALGARLTRIDGAFARTDLEVLENWDMDPLPTNRKLMAKQEIARVVHRRGVSFPVAAGESLQIGFRSWVASHSQIAGYVVVRLPHQTNTAGGGG